MSSFGVGRLFRHRRAVWPKPATGIVVPAPLGTVVAAICVLLVTSGCTSSLLSRQPLLDGVVVEPALITPDGDGDRDVARITYRIGRPALVTIALIADDGTEHLLRDERRREPHKEPYEALFGGVIDERMLPDGAYTVRLEAQPIAGGAPAVEEHPLTIEGADTNPPVLEGFAVAPTRFTPNQDGLDDRVSISYRLDKPAEVTLSLVDESGEFWEDILERLDSAAEPGAIGPHVYDYDAGVDANAPPPPDGQYWIVGEARDAAGNVSRTRAPLEIVDGGLPVAAMFGDASWSARRLVLGETLYFTVTVRNVGNTPIRTRGPEPGTVYDNNQSFNQQAPPGFLLLARAAGGVAQSLRVPAADAEVVLELQQPDGQPRPSPGSWRASAAADVAPTAIVTGVETTGAAGSAVSESSDSAAAAGMGAGTGVGTGTGTGPGTVTGTVLDTRTVTGVGTSTGTAASGGTGTDATGSVTICGTVTHDSVAVADAEVFAFQSDGDDGVATETDQSGRFCFDDLRVPPAHELNFSRSPGALRVGLEYDARRTEIDHPYRWQVGPTVGLDVCAAEERLYLCLAPQSSVRVSGGVRFVEAPFGRNFNVWLSLMHEDVRIMQGPFDVHAIAIDFERGDGR